MSDLSLPEYSPSLLEPPCPHVRRGHLHNRCLFSHCCGYWKPKTKVRHGWVLARAQWPPSLCPRLAEWETGHSLVSLLTLNTIPSWDPCPCVLSTPDHVSKHQLQGPARCSLVGLWVFSLSRAKEAFSRRNSSVQSHLLSNTPVYFHSLVAAWMLGPCADKS